VRAHLRYCRPYRLNQDLASPAAPGSRQPLPKSEGERENVVADASLQNASGSSIAYTRRRASNESLLTLLSGAEDLWELVKETAEQFRLSRLFASLPGQPYLCDEWEQLVRELVPIRQHYQAMVDHLCLDHAVLYAHYQHLLQIRDRWLYMRAKLGGNGGSSYDEDDTSQQPNGQADHSYEQLFDDLLAKFKKLVVASRIC
jgi:hypothetical protein